MIEVGLLTPPVGLNLYVLQGVTGEPMRDVIVGSAPFIILQFAMVAALYYWPAIAMYLPRLVMG
jgi:TRAP-type C4-dicarboxylate transport system permease large subunit